MKIGIFTFHSQLNYGGVLQAYALQQTLKGMGHEVFVIDRWLVEKNRTLVGTFPEAAFLEKCRRLLYAALGSGLNADMLRRQRTSKFIRENLKLTPYHFLDWKTAPESLSDFDCFIIGSDQVWNIQYPENLFYLLTDDAPDVPKISYAASMGEINALNAETTMIFKKGLKGFKAISVREKTAQSFIRSLGFTAEHVVDPTLLASREVWKPFKGEKDGHRRLFCYFMESNLKEVFPYLGCYAAATGSHIDVFFNNISQYAVGFSRQYGYLRDWWKLQKATLCSRVHFHLGAGPAEFVKYASMATDAISDSFHALMFSIIFKLNVRMLAPTVSFRTKMFARIHEFENCVNNGELVVPDISHAIKSIQQDASVVLDDARIISLCEHSRAWLQNAIAFAP